MSETQIKQCQNCKNQFVIEPDDFQFYEKMSVQAPVFCPSCRFKRRAAFRNERTLYKRTCDLCKTSIITMYNPKSPFPVYCNNCWISDKWNPFSYAMEYDLSQPFFDQLANLIKRVPKSATYSSVASGPNINSEYANFAGGNKDAYLVFNCGPNNENIAYSRGLIESRDTFDAYFGDQIERVYEGISVHKSAGIRWGQNVSGSLNSWFLLNCANCQDCFGCINLRHKSYHFFNEPLSKEEWRKRVDDIVGSFVKIEETKKRFAEFSLKFPQRENNNLKSVNCTGDYIFESKNCRSCFEVSFAEDCSYAFAIKKANNCYDVIGHCRNSELILEGVGVGAGANKVIGSWWVENSHDISYSLATRSSEYCIGCDGMKRGKYIILNKQYTKDEYECLRAYIIDELKSKSVYGLFFPPQLALFAYNETIGQDNMPLTESEASQMGFRWEHDIPATKGQETLPPEKIPDHIRNVSDDILKEVLACVSCGRNYRLIRPELDFYRQMVIPIPHRCWNCRFLERIKKRGSFVLYDRMCAKCGKAIHTTYAPDSPEIIYCEECYQREVV